MSGPVYTDVIREIGHTDERPLTVRPWPDDPSFVNLCAVGPDAESHWGVVNLALHPDLAEALGRALIAAANEAREAKQ